MRSIEHRTIWKLKALQVWLEVALEAESEGDSYFLGHEDGEHLKMMIGHLQENLVELKRRIEEREERGY